MKKPILKVMLLSLLLSSSICGQHRHWRELSNQNFIAFDWNCSRKESFPSKALSKVVHRAISPEDLGRPATYGDRAFTFALRKHGPTVYFVPTVCGATGNCTWRLYTINPGKYLGKINGQYIYTYQSSQGMPTIITYGHLSVSEGVLDTYSFKKARYAWVGDHYPIGPEDRDLDIQKGQGHRMPKFLSQARAECRDLGR